MIMTEVKNILLNKVICSEYESRCAQLDELWIKDQNLGALLAPE